MNVYDSRRMADVLIPLGYSYTDDPKKAEVVILNTCHIREKAAEKLYSELGRYANIKEKRNLTKIDKTCCWELKFSFSIDIHF